MKRFITILLAVAGVALASTGHAVTSGVHGQPLRTGGVSPSVQPQINGGINPADTVAWAIPLNADGVYMQSAFPIQDANGRFTAIIDDTSNFSFADSSAVLDVHAYRNLVLLIKATIPDSIATPFLRLAISARIHLNGQSDSSSTFPVPLAPAGFTSTGTIADGDSIAVGGTAAGTALAANFSTEFVLTLFQESAIASKWASPPARALPLSYLFQMPVWADYISIRIRVIGQGAKSTTKTARITAHLIGSPL